MSLTNETLEAQTYAGELMDERLIEALQEELSRLGDCDRVLLTPSTHGALRNRLLTAVASRQPLSLIRLGDGEGNTLFWGTRRDTYPQLAHVCMDRIWKVMFGAIPQEPSTTELLYQGMEAAIEGATFLGIPTPQQADPALQRLLHASDAGFDLRGTTGVVGVWDWLAGKSETIFTSDRTFTNWHVHTSLLGFYGDLVCSAENISVISCYPGLLPLLHSRFRVTQGSAYLIPPQAVNIKGTPDSVHFPKRYSEICSHLSGMDLTGRLFFVGAGLPGKLYCEVVRKAGGMAIDVGSLMDVWMGQGVRPYQTPGFVDQHSLLRIP